MQVTEDMDQMNHFHWSSFDPFNSVSGSEMNGGMKDAMPMHWTITPKEEIGSLDPLEPYPYNLYPKRETETKTEVTETRMVKTRRRTSSTGPMMAERKRREKLNQQFAALSALVPDLKKLDKASVIANAVTYVKKLQERVEDLQNQAKGTLNNMINVKKSYLPLDQETSTYNDDDDGSSNAIEANIFDDEVMLRLQCSKRKGILVKILAEIEKLHLSIMTASTLPFDGSIIINIVAKMEKEFSLTVEDLGRILNSIIV